MTSRFRQHFFSAAGRLHVPGVGGRGDARWPDSDVGGKGGEGRRGQQQAVGFSIASPPAAACT